MIYYYIVFRYYPQHVYNIMDIYNSKTKHELIEICKINKITGYSNICKPKIIEKIINFHMQQINDVSIQSKKKR